MSIIDFEVHVDNPANVLAIFDRIQIWRATSEEGTYTDITANDPAAAVLDGTVTGPWDLDGLSLTVVLNMAAAQVITFDGDELSLQDVLEQINNVFTDFALEVPTDTDCVRLISSVLGTQSSIIVSGSAASVLGLPTSKVNGKGARLLLSASTEEYTFRDFDGDISFWYKARYYNSVTGAVSAFSTAQPGGAGTGLSSDLKVTGSLALVAIDGSPIVGRRIIFVPIGTQLIEDSGSNFGILPSVDRVIATTDANGVASLSLVKGQRLKVFLEGTTFQREFVVPDDDFDILEVASAEPDPFSIVVAPPSPIRVS